MTHVVAISPHLDDAAFSAGGTLARHRRDGARVTVLTCFTGNVARPAGFALACQLDKGLDSGVDYMALRRAEDKEACAVIDAEICHLPFLEAPHRGYDSADTLFAGKRADDDVGTRLIMVLKERLRALAPDLVLGPLALGNHVDHLIVRDAMTRTCEDQALLWEDWPYLDRPAVRRPDPPALDVMLDDDLRATRTAMCAAYTTQISYQFGGVEALTARIGAIETERFHRP